MVRFCSCARSAIDRFPTIPDQEIGDRLYVLLVGLTTTDIFWEAGHLVLATILFDNIRIYDVRTCLRLLGQLSSVKFVDTTTLGRALCHQVLALTLLPWFETHKNITKTVFSM